MLTVFLHLYHCFLIVAHLFSVTLKLQINTFLIEKWKTENQSKVDHWTKWVSSALVHWNMRIVFKKYLYCFWSKIGSLWMLRAKCMHWSMALYIGNLSLFGFWHLQGVTDPISCRCRGTAGVVIRGFFNCAGISFPNPCGVQGSAVVWWFLRSYFYFLTSFEVVVKGIALE